MTTFKLWRAFLNSHDSLSARLKMPLKQTQQCGGAIFSSRRMPGGDDDVQEDAPSLLLSKDALWDPAWQLANDLFDSESDIV
jgi:hypothetical protein